MYWLICSFSVSPFCHTIWLVICLHYSFWHRSFRQKKHSHQVSTVWCEISEYIYTTQHLERNTRVSYYSDHLKTNMLSLTTHCYKLGSIVVSKTLFSKLTLGQIVLFMVNRKYMSRQITESKISSSTPRYPTRYHF